MQCHISRRGKEAAEKNKTDDLPDVLGPKSNRHWPWLTGIIVLADIFRLRRRFAGPDRVATLPSYPRRSAVHRPEHRADGEVHVPEPDRIESRPAPCAH
jgi:hypothetical protein